MNTYTLTEISQILCEADGLVDRKDRKITHERVRHLAKRCLLYTSDAADE